MQRTVLFIVAAGALAAAAYYATRPEPTAADRLSEAVEDAGQAARDVAEELTIAANEAADSVQSQVENRSAEFESQAGMVADAVATRLSDTSRETQDRLFALLQIWREAGIVTQSGIDFDAAIDAVEETDMSTESREQVVRLLEFMRDAPAAAEIKLAALEAALKQ